MARGDVRHGFSTNFAHIRIGKISTHRLQHLVNACAGRVHANMGDGDFTTWGNEGRNNEEGGGRRIAGNLNLLRLQFGLTHQADMPNTIGIHIDGQIRAKSAQHAFAMVAGRDWLNDFGNARDVQPRQQDSAFDLRGGDRQAVTDRHGRHQSAHHQWQHPPRACRKLRPHLAEWINDAAHRAFGQACIANEGCG